MLLGRLLQQDMVETAKTLYRGQPMVASIMKAAVDSHGIDSELYSPNRLTTDFAANVQAQSVLGRIPAPISAPMATPLAYLSARSQFAFFGGRMPGVAFSFGTNISLLPKRIGGIAVFSRELLERSQAEAVIRSEMTQGLIEALDVNLLDPSLTTTDDRPGAVTNGADEIDATGAETAADVDGVVGDLLAVLATSNFTNAVFITDHTNAVALSLLRDTSGARAFPGMSATGGTLAGLPLVASGSAPIGVLTVLDTSELLLGDEHEIEVSTSTEALIEQDDAPDGDNTLMSLFQTESIALRVTRTLDWSMRRDGHVAYASNFAPSAPSSTTA
jgi:hypothetical protein